MNPSHEDQGTDAGRVTDAAFDAAPAGRERRGTRHAVVNRLKCTGCGLCEEICPAEALRVTYIAIVDRQRCTGCGKCVETCPNGALSLSSA